MGTRYPADIQQISAPEFSIVKILPPPNNINPSAEVTIGDRHPSFRADAWTASTPKELCLNSYFRQLKRIVPLVVYTFLVWSSQLPGQPMSSFQDFTQKEGLSSNYVLSIIKDHLGFLWIGTENGLNRFDGERFIEFRFDPEDSTSLSGNWITALYEDQQHNLWVGSRTGLARLDRNNGTFERIPLQTETGETPQAEITSCLADGAGNLWVLTLHSGLFKVDLQDQKGPLFAKRFAYQELSSTSATTLRLSHLIRFSEDYLWLATTQGVDRIHISSQEILRLKVPDLDGYFSGEVDHIKSVVSQEGQIILQLGGDLFDLVEENGNYQLKHKLRFPSLQSPQLSTTTKLRHLSLYDKNSILTSDLESLYLVDMTTGEQRFFLAPEDKATHFSHIILPLSVDSQQGVWIGTAGSGLRFIAKENTYFTTLEHKSTDPNSLSSGAVRSFAEDRHGKTWIGTLGGGIDQFSPSTHKHSLEKIRHIGAGVNGLSDDSVIKVLADQREDYLWVATNQQGLNRVNTLTGEIRWYLSTSDGPNTISGNRIWGLEQDQAGYIWIGTWAEGLNRLDPVSGNIQYYTAKPDPTQGPIGNDIRYLYTAPDGILWIGTFQGLSRFDPKTETFQSFLHMPNAPNSLSNNLVWAIHQDQHGFIWVGTDIGLNRLDPSTGRFQRFYEKDGLPSNTIYGLEVDQQGDLWISTDKGLARHTPNDKKPAFYTLEIEDEMGSVSFIPKAILHSPNTNLLLLGSVDKMIIVNPAEVEKAPRDHQLQLHAFSKFRVTGEEGRTEIDYFIAGKKEEVCLAHQDQSITLQLCDLSWQRNGNYRFEYQLAGFNRQWMQLPENMEVTFTNLDPGKYNFLVRTQSTRNETTPPLTLLALEVLPPWWESSVAYLGYFLLLLGLGYLVYRFQLQRQLDKLETENLKALDSFKTRLYTNITHEFKTPLTVISGVIEQVEGHNRVKNLIRRSSSNLLHLINQILDLRKLEEGRLQVTWVQGDIIQYLKYILASFEALAGLKNINLHFLSGDTELLMDFDKEKLQRILSNLLSNAIKFTPPSGDIYLQLSQTVESGTGPALSLSVKDTGIGIPEENQQHIFDRFYQVPVGASASEVQFRGPGKGTGIGLAMTKELVQLMRGKISVSSKEGEGATFTLSLPIHRNAPIISLAALTEENERPATALPFPPPPTEGPAQAAAAEAPRLLLIEDNPDVMQYLIALLENKYQLLLASDGQAGIEMALAQIPDLIVSDVMMPIKDGLEVCGTLKMDRRTSHIPIILLTAKSSIASKLAGLERGADAYLAKPFDQRELLIRLERLAQLRQELQARYQAITPLPKPEKSTTFAQEDAFINQLQEAIQAKMKDSEFGIKQLCQDMGMSRSQLHLKIKALTNRSTSHFIRAIRLRKAKDLLKDASLNVTEISYEVGFNDPAYFSKKFTEEFGMSPKKYMGNQH